MKAKHAYQIRHGIMEARKLFPAYHLLTRLEKKAFHRETRNHFLKILKGDAKFQLFSA